MSTASTGGQPGAEGERAEVLGGPEHAREHRVNEQARAILPDEDARMVDVGEAEG
jgi:hypothetical protein